MKRDDVESLADTAVSDVGPAGSRGVDSQLTSASVIASANTVAPSTRPAPAQPDVLPEVPHDVYIHLDEFARGGLGRIIRAKDTRTGRTVAIKEMLTSSADAAARFVREALVTSNLQHPAIVPVYEVGRWPTGQPFYAMKLVKGRPLDQVIAATHDLNARLALLPHVVAVADALAYAHGERVIHRDLKPHNVLCGAHGETVVIDWGLARRLEDDDPSTSMPRVTSAPPGATYVGAVMGTPGYMPPEQAWGERVDERADVYAIGAILYHVLSGKPAYTGKDLHDVIDKVRSAGPASLRAVENRVPPDLATIVERAMAREPASRYPSAAELAADLKRFTEGQLVLSHHYTTRQRVRRFIARNRGILVIASVGVTALAVVGVLSIRNVVAARDLAREEGARADENSARAEHRLIAAHLDRARAELAGDHPEIALAFVVAAANKGSLDEESRFIAGRALDRLPPIRRHAMANVGASAFVPGTDDLVISDNNGVVRWSPDSDREHWRVPGAAGDLLMVNGTLVAGREDIALIDVASGKITGTLAPSPGTEMLGYVGADHDRKWLASPTKTTVELFEVATRTRVATIPIAGADASPLVDRTGTKAVLTLPVSSFVEQLVIADRAGHQTPLCMNCVRYAWAGDDEIVFATVPEYGKSARVAFADWNGKVRVELRATSNSNVLDMVADPSSGLLAISLQDGTVEVHEIATGKRVWQTTIRDRPNQVLFDHGRLWVLGAYSAVIVFDARSGVEVDRWMVTGIWIGLESTRKRVAIMHPRDGMATWPLDSSPITPIVPAPGRVRRVVFLRDGSVASSSEDGTVAVFDASGKPRVIGKHAERATELAQLANGSLMSSSRDGTTVVWDLAAGKHVKIPAGPRAAAARDGTIATAGLDGTVKLWAADGSAIRTLGKLPLGAMGVRWSPDDKRIGAIDEAGELKVWDREGREVRALPATKRGIDLVFSPDGKWVARLAEGDRKLFALDGGPDRPLEVHSDAVNQVYGAAFTNDGARVQMVGTGFVSVWNVATGDSVSSVSTHTDLIAGGFLLGDHLMFAGGLDRMVHVWHVATGTELAMLPAPEDVYAITVDRDDKRLGIATLGAGMVWRLPKFAGDLAALAAITGCRSDVEVRDDGTLRRTTIDVPRCNRQHAGR